MEGTLNPLAQFDHFRSLALDENVAGMGAMLDAGFDVNTANESRQTVFMHCCANNRLRAARLLAARGADLNLADLGGATPMDYAVSYASRAFTGWLDRAGGRSNSSLGYSHPSTPAHS
jgi:ankyrin repeat protein